MQNDFKVLFIYPNVMMATLVPIHVSQLSSCLKEKGFQVELFDTTYYKTEEKSFDEKKVELLQVKPFSLSDKGVGYKETDMLDDLRKKIKEYQPDLIGITMVEDTCRQVLSLLEAIKPFKIPVIAGGVFATFSPEDVIANDGIDMICCGEGEEAIVELCDKMSKGKDYSDIRNLWVKKDGEIIKNPIRPLTNIDRLPFIDYDIFERKRLYRPMYGKIYTMIHVEIDRGCPYECNYCEAPQLRALYRQNGHGQYYRRKTPERIIKEIKYLSEKYKADYVDFNSETFLAKPIEELKEFAEYYKQIGLPFWCQSRPETVTEEKIKILKNMNCKNLQFGLEHGNEEFRTKILNRRCSNDKIVKALKIVEKYNISYTVNNIIGFPDETRELIFDTIALNRQINPSTMNCYSFVPYKGTALYAYCLEKEYIDKDVEINQLLGGAELKKRSLSYKELQGLQRTFPLYVKFPEKEWDNIRVAERFDDEGNQMFEGLRDKYWAKYF